MDILNQGFRKTIIDEIESDENKRRKAEHVKRRDVFNDYQRAYVLGMLVKEFSPTTVSEMRTCTSINLSKRIITEMASIYKKKPTRVFSNLSEAQEEGMQLIYADSKANVKLKKANQKFKLHDQCTIQVLPSEGSIGLKILAPHQYDVIPMPGDPEKPFAYVISSNDRGLLDTQNQGKQDIQGSYYGSKNEAPNSGTNKTIADENDYKEMKRYVIWTAENNLVCDGNGNLIESYPNPIGMLPFIDVSSEKDFEFWVRRGSGVVDFALDFSVVISDTCNTNRLQSYAQPVIVAEKVPESITVGPQHILFLPLDPTRPEAKPSFEFANPQPDMNASLSLQDRLVSYFLTSMGIDPKTIASSGEGNKFSSGLERLLAMIERFEASQDDIDLFTCIESDLYKLIKAWYGVILNTPALDPKYNFGAIPEDTELKVVFCGPEMVQTKSDTEDSVIKRLEAGLISKLEAIMEIRGVDEEKAIEILSKIEGIDQTTVQGA